MRPLVLFGGIMVVVGIGIALLAVSYDRSWFNSENDWKTFHGTLADYTIEVPSHWERSDPTQLDPFGVFPDAFGPNGDTCTLPNTLGKGCKGLLVYHYGALPAETQIPPMNAVIGEHRYLATIQFPEPRYRGERQAAEVIYRTNGRAFYILAVTDHDLNRESPDFELLMRVLDTIDHDR